MCKFEARKSTGGTHEKIESALYSLMSHRTVAACRSLATFLVRGEASGCTAVQHQCLSLGEMEIDRIMGVLETESQFAELRTGTWKGENEN